MSPRSPSPSPAYFAKSVQEAAFQDIKIALASPLVMSCPNFVHPFTLQTDASTIGRGAFIT